MLAVLCDACGRSITERGYACDLVEAKPVALPDAPPRLTERGKILSLMICPACAQRVQATLQPGLAAPAPPRPRAP